LQKTNFFSEDTEYEYKGKKKSREWIVDVIHKEGSSPGDLNFIFCSDQYLYDMNVKYLDHDTYTDIITFDLSEETDTISGDIFISVDRARENAKAYKTTLTQELRRLIVHGILHLLGFKDKTDGEKALMRQKEDYYLSLHP
jgi:rRNA maturation RNase YbeY